MPPRPYISAPLAVHLRPSDRTPAVFSFKGGLIFAIPAWVFPLFRPARPFPTRPARSRPARPFPTPTRPFPLPTRPFTHSAFEPPPAGRVTGAEAETGRRGRRSCPYYGSEDFDVSHCGFYSTTRFARRKPHVVSTREMPPFGPMDHDKRCSLRLCSPFPALILGGAEISSPAGHDTDMTLNSS